MGIVHSIRVGIWRSWCGGIHPWWGCFDIYLGIVEGMWSFVYYMMGCIIVVLEYYLNGEIILYISHLT